MSTYRGNPACGRKYMKNALLRAALIIDHAQAQEGFKLIGSFVSARRAGNFLGMSGSTVNKYRNSGKIFKDRYKFFS